jgi:23S rRNA (guanosine2251-2'-O)-methyltransferase
MRAVERPRVKVTILLQDVEDPVNVGSAFRIGDAAKVEQIVLTGISAQPPHPLITKVGRGKDRRVAWRYEQDVEVAIGRLKEDGWTLCAVEITPDAEPYYAVDWPEKTCIVVGHEDHGVTKKALAHCDKKVFIPMYGKGASLNVHVALAIVAFQALHSER